MKNPKTDGTVRRRAVSTVSLIGPAFGVIVGFSCLAIIYSMSDLGKWPLVALAAIVVAMGASVVRMVDRASARYLARFYEDLSGCPNCPEGYDCSAGVYATISPGPEVAAHWGADDCVCQECTSADVDKYGRQRREAWSVYHMNHPKVIASWGEQNGRWPRCACRACDPSGFKSVTT